MSVAFAECIGGEPYHENKTAHKNQEHKGIISKCICEIQSEYTADHSRSPAERTQYTQQAEKTSSAKYFCKRYIYSAVDNGSTYDGYPEDYRSESSFIIYR